MLPKVFILFVLLLSLFITKVSPKHHKKKSWNSRITQLQEDFNIRNNIDTIETEDNIKGDKDTDFPNLLSLLGTETETGHEYKLFGCVIKVDKGKCNIKFLPQEKSCHEKLSFARLFDFVFKKTKLKTITKNYIPLENFQINYFFLNKCDGNIQFQTIAKEPFDIIKNKLTVRKGELSLDFNYKTLQESPSFTEMGIDLNGEIEISKIKVPLRLKKVRGSEEGKFSIKLEEISAADFANSFSKKKEVTDDDTPEEAGMFTNAVIKQPIITGSRDVNGAYEIVLKGEAIGIEGFGPFMVFVIIQKQLSSPTAVAIVADIKNINPTKVLSALTGKDLTNIPIIKHITVNVAVEFANYDMMVLKDEDLNKVLVKYIANAKTISAGTKIKLDIPIRKILQDTGSVASLKHVPKNMFVEIFLHKGKVCFRFPDNAMIDLFNVLVALVPKVPEILFKHVLKKPPPVIIKKFDVDVATSAVDLKLDAAKEIVLGENLLTLKAAEFELTHKPDSDWNFKIRSEQSIGKATLKVLIEKIGNEYEFKGEISDLTTEELVLHFGAPKAQKTLQKLKFLNFGVRNLKFFTKFGDKFKLHIKGQPVFFGFEDIFFEGYIFDTDKDSRFALTDESVETKGVKKQIIQQTITTSDATANKTAERLVSTDTTQPIADSEADTAEEEPELDTEEPEDEVLKAKYDRKMAFGLVMKHIRIDEIVEKLFHKTILKRSWLNDLNLCLTISNTVDTKEVHFTLPELKKVLKLREGVFFTTELTIPKDCKGDSLCEIARDKMLPGTKIFLEGAISALEMRLTGGYHGGGLKLGKKLVLNKVNIVFRVGSDGVEFYIEGDLKIAKPELTLRGRVAVGVTGKLELQLTMLGMWKKPFGIPFISFGNIAGIMAVYPAIPIPKLELTGEVWIGSIGNNHELKVKAAIGVNPVYPLDDFFYADVNKLTIESLAQAFGWDLPLPKVLIDSGFPEGLIVSFTMNPKGKNIEHLDAKIKMGFQFRGMIKLLGLKLKCEILVNFPQKISVQVDMLPLSIGKGLIKFQRSKKDIENGPQVYVGISLTEVAVRMQAYAELLGIGSEVLIDISNRGMEFYIYGNLFNLLEANVTVKAPYGKGNLLESEFMVGACLSASIADVTLNAKETVSGAVEDTEEAVQVTNEKAKHAGSWYNKATQRMNDWDESIRKKEEAIRRKSSKLDVIRDVLDDDCVDVCEDICLGGPTVDKHCKKILGKWIPCPAWDKCATMVEDPICLAKCKGNQVYLDGKALKKRVTIEILLDAIEIIRKILKLVKGLVEKSKTLIDSTEQAARKVEKATVKAKSAMYALAKYTKENLIDIHHLCFNTTLEQASSACFGFSVNVTLGGRKNFKLDTNACLDVSFIRNIGEAITEKLFPGILSVKDILDKAKDHFKKADKEKEELEEYKRNQQKKEAELQGQIDEDKINEDSEDGEEDEMLKRKTEVHKPDQSKSNEYIKSQIYGEFPEVFIHDDLTMDAFSKRSPWAYSQKHSPFTKSRSFKKDFNDTEVVVSQQRSLDFDALEDPEDTSACEQSKRVLSTYSMISDTIKLITDRMANERKEYENDAKRFQTNIELTEQDLIRKCKKANVSADRAEQLMDLVKLTREGAERWMKDTDKQINIHDQQFLQLWRKSFTHIIKSNRNEDTAAFVRSLHEISHLVVKKSQIPDHKRSEVEERMKSASKIVKDLLVGKIVPLSTKYASVITLQNDLETLKQEMQFPCAA